MTNQTNLMELIHHSYRLKKDLDSVHDDMRNIGFDVEYGIARMSIALSLSDSTPINIDEQLPGENGKTLKGAQLFGTENPGLIIGLIHQHAGCVLSKAQFSNAVTAHWVRGLRVMEEMWRDSDREIEVFIKNLLKKSDFLQGLDGQQGIPGMTSAPQPIKNEGASWPVDFSFGEADSKPVSWRVNAPGGSPHLAVMGQPNTGKTRLALDFARSVKEQSDCAVVVFDMGKGDIAADSEFVDSIGASVVDCSKNPVPLDVLFSGKDLSSRQKTALRFTDALSVVNRLGDVQKNRLREIVSNLLEGGEKISINDVNVAVNDFYKDDAIREDTVIASLNLAASFNLLSATLSPAEFFSKSWVLDMHTTEESLQRFVAFLVLSAFNTYIMQRDEAPVDRDDNRKIISLLVVDEARKVLGYDHPALTDIIKMSRSKGGVVALCSQTPDDYDTDRNDFLSDIGVYACFRTGARPASIKRVFKQALKVSDLEKGKCFVQLPGTKPQRVIYWK